MRNFNDLAKRTGLFGTKPLPSEDSSHSRDMAQVCLNGHLINWSFAEEPEDNEDYCAKCGAKTITNCTNCKRDIPGKPLKHGVVMIANKPPLHCIHCGEMYPWTISKIQAAKDAIREFEDLSDDQKSKLSSGIDDLVNETPRAGVVVVLFKKMAKNIGADGWAALKKLLFEIVSKEIKEKLGMTSN